MNFKDAYRAANEEIHGDRSILAGISGREPQKTIIYFKPAMLVATAAAVCLVTLFSYPYFTGNNPQDNKELSLNSQETGGMKVVEKEATQSQQAHTNDNSNVTYNFAEEKTDYNTDATEISKEDTQISVPATNTSEPASAAKPEAATQPRVSTNKTVETESENQTSDYSEEVPAVSPETSQPRMANEPRMANSPRMIGGSVTHNEDYTEESAPVMANEASGTEPAAPGEAEIPDNPAHYSEVPEPIMNLGDPANDAATEESDDTSSPIAETENAPAAGGGGAACASKTLVKSGICSFVNSDFTEIIFNNSEIGEIVVKINSHTSVVNNAGEKVSPQNITVGSSMDISLEQAEENAYIAKKITLN